MESRDLGREAEDYVKRNKKELVARMTDEAVFPPAEAPLSILMAGSPGAGKTEFSQNLLKDPSEDLFGRVVRLDPDEMRALMPGYDGTNSSRFQKAVSLLVEAAHHAVLAKGQSFLLDGTMSHYEKAAENVRRSLSRGRSVVVFYIYQEPAVAWRFTQAREVVDGRNITPEVFARKFVAARENVERLREEFGNEVQVFLVSKNAETHRVDKVVPIRRGGPSVASLLGALYTEGDIIKEIDDAGN